MLASWHDPPRPQGGGVRLETSGGELQSRHAHRLVFATDLEAMLAKVTAAGGVITRPIFTFPGGRRFHFCDPSGNELAVWSRPTGS